MFQRGKCEEVVTGPWHPVGAHRDRAFPHRDPGIRQSLAEILGSVIPSQRSWDQTAPQLPGALWALESPSFPAPVTPIPPEDAPKAVEYSWGWNSPGREQQEVSAVGCGWAQGRIGPNQSYFCREKENCAFAPWIMDLCVFPPAVTGE